jgi:hypothetical protein
MEMLKNKNPELYNRVKQDAEMSVMNWAESEIAAYHGYICLVVEPPESKQLGVLQPGQWVLLYIYKLHGDGWLDL